MRHYSLRTMIAVRFALIVLTVILLISIASNILISMQFEKYVGEQQSKEAEEIALNLSHQYDNASGEWNLDYVHGLGMYAMNEGYIIKLYDRNENILWDAQNHDMTLCSQMMDAISNRMQENRPELNGDFVARRFDLRQGKTAIGFLDVSYYSPYYLNENDFQFIEALNRILVAVGIVCLLGAVGMGLILANDIAKPIAKTVEITEQISVGDYSIRFKEGVRTKELFGLSRAVNQMAESLEEQETLRKRLTTDEAHELRTPLANVSSYLEAIIEGVWEPTQERLKSCYDELERISKLVSELERLKQVENENLKLHKTDVDLLELARSVVQNFARQMEDRNLHCDISGEHAVLLIDRGRMQQAITNIVSNAVNYSDENGNIRIVMENRKDVGIIRVEDEGIGIAEGELKLIFERFYRTDKSRSRRTGGAGIGLTIANAIVRAHGGTISAESEVGHGSCFVITLPKG
ncbi:MAG: HAMP domain-containing histidine kinase [Lachnospiraceae bacterium]|nr:HAMP domain-containing histidine kinase [Lachnospiraceae bacterium]